MAAKDKFLIPWNQRRLIFGVSYLLAGPECISLPLRDKSRAT